MSFQSENQLHAYLLQAADELRAVFAEHNMSRLDFTIEIEGRPDGDLTLKYGLGEYSSDVQADTLSAVVDEYFRRKGWEKRHNPICLPAAGAPVQPPAKTDDEIPF